MPESSPSNPAGHPLNLWLSVAVAAFAVISLVAGLLILPARDENAFDPFLVICRALGLPGYEKIPPDPGAAHASAPVSDVAWSVDTEHLLAGANIASGAALAKNICGSCHGVDGKSIVPMQFPNLAGQLEPAIFKELRDFRSGDRTSPFMQPIAQMLKDQQMADVAAYYAAQPAVAVRGADAVPAKILALVHDGDPDRAIPPCESCHGANRSGPEGAPILLGQSVDYLELQLKNFAAGQRRNDLFERMRTIARQLTPAETHALAVYYAGIAGH